MRVMIITFGTLGDVLPYIALGLRIQQAGYEVYLATHHNFEAVIRSRGLNFFPVGGNFKELIKGREGQAIFEPGKSPLSFIHRCYRFARPYIHQQVTDIWNLGQEADTIICSITGWLVTYHILERLKIPSFGAHYSPFTPTRAYPIGLWPSRIQLGGLHNYVTYRIVQESLWQLFRQSVNEARGKVLNLPALPLASSSPFRMLHKQGIPFLYGYSRHVLPKPPDWGNEIHVTGYWFLDHSPDWQPPSDLVDFLQSGPPPVYIGFGSTPDPNPEQMTGLVLKALRLSRQRGILVDGWGALSNANLPDDVFKTEFVPFDWLFPKVAAVVHHGGAGTTALGVRAGIPSVVIPFIPGQLFWGYRMAKLGVGPQPIPRKHLSAERLSAAIYTAVHDKDMRVCASALGQLIRAEDGVARAVEIFHHYLPQSKGFS